MSTYQTPSAVRCDRGVTLSRRAAQDSLEVQYDELSGRMLVTRVQVFRNQL